MAASSRRNRRQFEWARAAGYGAGVPQGAVALGGVDLLASVREDYGAAYLRGATVMTVKGWLRPYVPDTERVSGVAGIRVCNYADLQSVTADQTPGGALGGEADWMAYLPYDVGSNVAGYGSDTIPATWNPGGSMWGLDVQSSRRMNEAGYTLGLFWWHSPITSPDDPSVVANLDYHLSVGLKLA